MFLVNFSFPYIYILALGVNSKSTVFS